MYALCLEWHVLLTFPKSLQMMKCRFVCTRAASPSKNPISASSVECTGAHVWHRNMQWRHRRRQRSFISLNFELRVFLLRVRRGGSPVRLRSVGVDSRVSSDSRSSRRTWTPARASSPAPAAVTCASVATSVAPRGSGSSHQHATSGSQSSFFAAICRWPSETTPITPQRRLKNFCLKINTWESFRWHSDSNTTFDVRAGEKPCT